MSNIVHKTAGRPDVLVHVAANVRRLRQAAGLSQQALAARADVSRRMLVNVEKGDVNVSLNTLDRLADALGVLFYGLVQPPEAEDSARINELAWVGQYADSHATLLASTAARQEVELWAWSLAPGERYESPADPPGWSEMLFVLCGRLTLQLSGEDSTIACGDFRVFSADQPHGYANLGNEPLRFLRNVVY